ncbi:hypothetical protein [Convivina intestini]|uniref:hypothetical protein n=1 Tax=Convivina intestini TaxID=1505726 RepID=UPI002010C230|nr:hypothetical protein [Convivina intestini]CAH1850249.1 hypothetical protein R078131_00052 [Convivina intestini]
MVAIKRVCNFLFNSLTLIAVSLVLLVAFFFNNDSVLLDFPIRIVLTVLYAIVIYGIYKIIRQYNIKLFYPVIVLLLALQLWLVLTTNNYLFTDSGYVYIQAQNLATNHYEWMDYFYIYPNNVNTVIFWSGIYRIFNWIGISNSILAAQLLQLVVLDFSILLLGWMLQRINKGLIGKIFIIISLIFLPYTMFTKFLYNDIFVVSFAMIFMAGLIYVNQRRDDWKGVVVFTLGSLPLAIACLLRQNMMVILIAVLIGLAFSKISWKRSLYQSLIILLFVVLASFGFNRLQQSNHFQKQPDVAHPTLSWVNMGLNPETSGEISGDAWLYEKPGLTYSQKSNLYAQSIKSRLKEYIHHPKTMIQHFLRKIQYMYTVGFAYQDFSQWYVKGTVQKSILSKYGSITANLFQPLYILFYISVGFVLYRSLKISAPFDSLVVNIASLSILGVFLFQIGLWEVRDRYSFITTPFVMLLAAYGLNYVGNWAYQSQIFNRRYVRAIGSVAVTALLPIILYSYKANQKESFKPIVKFDSIVKQPFFDYAGDHTGYLKPGEHLKVHLNVSHDHSQLSMGNQGFDSRYTSDDTSLEAKLIKDDRIVDVSNNPNLLFNNISTGRYILDIQNVSSKLIYPICFTNIGRANFISNPLFHSVENRPQLLPSMDVSVPYSEGRWTNHQYLAFFGVTSLLVILVVVLILFVF